MLFYYFSVIKLFVLATTELSTGRMDPRVGSGHGFAGFWPFDESSRVSTWFFF